MEKFPGSHVNTPEGAGEKILSKEAVLSALEHYGEKGAEVVYELSDEKGLCVLVTEKPGTAEGEITQHNYVRKGSHASGHKAAETNINVAYYEDGVAVDGEVVAKLNEETGEWL